MGLSGSGKSTIIRCLSRLVEPTAGEIILDGEDLLKKSSAELTEQELRDFLQDKLAAYKIPSFMQIGIEDLPRVASGKFSKKQLRDDFVAIESNAS